MLESAGLAIKALTARSASSPDEQPSQSISIEQQKKDFKTATAQYFSLLSSVDVRLRRQIYALEEAEIIPAEAPTKESQSTSTVPAALAALTNTLNVPAAKQAGTNKNISTSGGLGALDVGWLNSRNDSVGKDKEAELWSTAKDFIVTDLKETIKARGDCNFSSESDEIALKSSRETSPT